MRNSGQTEGGLEFNNAAFLEDVAQNADLYIANQGGSMQIQVYTFHSDVYSFKRYLCSRLDNIFVVYILDL